MCGLEGHGVFGIGTPHLAGSGVEKIIEIELYKLKTSLQFLFCEAGGIEARVIHLSLGNEDFNIDDLKLAALQRDA